ncbi:MAG: response regulator, partial [Okeania sp. SIO2H7]|nr:response regulator [Okeania sp. SIO2H7]
MIHKGNILVVDDTPANLEVLVETLSLAGYTVWAVTSGKRALKQLQTHIPDLILLDIQMPEMDGFTICEMIKANVDTAAVPVIFITAFSDTDSIVKGFSLGAVDYINKPFRDLELLARVQTHLNLRGLTQGLKEQVQKAEIAKQKAEIAKQEAEEAKQEADRA